MHAHTHTHTCQMQDSGLRLCFLCVLSGRVVFARCVSECASTSIMFARFAGSCDELLGIRQKCTKQSSYTSRLSVRIISSTCARAPQKRARTTKACAYRTGKLQRSGAIHCRMMCTHTQTYTLCDGKTGRADDAPTLLTLCAPCVDDCEMRCSDAVR